MEILPEKFLVTVVKRFIIFVPQSQGLESLRPCKYVCMLYVFTYSYMLVCIMYVEIKFVYVGVCTYVCMQVYMYVLYICLTL